MSIKIVDINKAYGWQWSLNCRHAELISLIGRKIEVK